VHSGVHGNTSIVVPDDGCRPLPAELLTNFNTVRVKVPNSKLQKGKG